MDTLDHFEELPRYGDWRPTAYDARGLGMDDRQDWRVMPTMRTRDSGPMEESNFACTLASLGGESEWVEVHRFGHWGPGWFEVMIVSPDAPEKIRSDAGGIACALESYPVLNESDLSEREEDAANEAWSCLSMRDRIEMCARAGVSIFAARREYYPDTDSGSIRDRLLGH